MSKPSGLTRPVVRLLWSPDGERLVYDTGAIDVATGEVYSCEEPVLAGIPADPVPGGHDIASRPMAARPWWLETTRAHSSIGSRIGW